MAVGADGSAGLWVLGVVHGRVHACRPDGGEQHDLGDQHDVAAWSHGVAERERDNPRWVWSDATHWYRPLLAAGVRVARCFDLRLGHDILVRSADSAARNAIEPAWRVRTDALDRTATQTLFDSMQSETDPHELDSCLRWWRWQEAECGAAAEAGRMRLLLAAESAGALIAEEMHAAGVPWDVTVHDTLLREALGERGPGGVPRRMAAAGEAVRAALGDPQLHLDSPPQVLASLRRAGLNVTTTSRWELAKLDHPAIAPLLAYKKMSRLLAANGWKWLAEWVHERRFRPVYVPGGVVTGRWASSGGGALQIPRALRPAVRADAGWTLVSADVAQLEPRVLAAMARDEAMARAAAGADLYEGIVAQGAVATRQEAKIAVLGAMYGATTGEAGRLVPRLRRAFPAAMALVDDAARTGERGGIVHTWLGRTSPPPGRSWHVAQRDAVTDESVDPGAGARRAARDRGRFTRNFVVQGTAAEWSLIWMAELRRRLWSLQEVTERVDESGPVFAGRAHLVFFLHDEVIVHTPQEHADEVAGALRAAAESAGRMLFGSFPIDFPLDVRIGRSAAKDDTSAR